MASSAAAPAREPFPHRAVHATSHGGHAYGDRLLYGFIAAGRTRPRNISNYPGTFTRDIDNSGPDLNPNETVLTAANVNTTQFWQAL